ncbi:MAG: asparagine synthase (glutamine-hydrolyzing) [Candidatus Acidiferrales bacterium]|jgi:asparagine synthase (glutamine-hydrolysing)
MCGICGVVEWDGARDATAREREIALMLECLIHRGPDGLGVDSRGPATLGAVRLAIRGLGDGRQPIVDEENGILAVCNGEIDNHVELRQWLASRGRSVAAATDVAVLPGLYLELGAAFVERLVGAFAIGLWSARDQTLLLARDRAGERPLHVITSPGRAQFASELAALAAGAPQPLTPDAEALRGYLSAGFFPAPHDPFRDVRRVAPGELLEITRHEIRSRRYWSWQPGVGTASAKPDANSGAGATTAASHSAGTSLDEFDKVFRTAVGRQSEVDVPYGVFLSGGVDSSLVAAVLRQLRPDYKLAAFALKFSEASYDESEHARRVAAALKVDLHCVEVGAEALPQTIAELVASSGEPLADPAWVPTALLARRAAQDVKIALVGEGADELFGGYPTYIGAEVYERYARWPAWMRAAVRWGVERWPVADKKVTLSFLLKRFVQGEGLDPIARHLLWTSTLAPHILARLGVAPVEMRRADFTAASSAQATDGAAILDRLQRLDLENSLAEGLLTKADRASMRYAIELRAPYLDVDVMEFAARLPAAERVRGFETKVFLKRFAERYLSSATVHRRKRGLSVPLARWLREPLYDWARTRLGGTWLDAAGVRPGAALELLEEHRQRRADNSRALWTLIVLSEWIEWAARRSSEPHEAHATSPDAAAGAQTGAR